MPKKLLLNCAQHVFNHIRNISSKTASITKIHRSVYSRMYPTLLVQPDGSSIRIRYHEPRQIIRLPLDMSTLTEDQRKQRLKLRREPVKLKVEEDLDDSFNAKKYLRYIKK